MVVAVAGLAVLVTDDGEPEEVTAAGQDSEALRTSSTTTVSTVPSTTSAKSPTTASTTTIGPATTVAPTTIATTTTTTAPQPYDFVVPLPSYQGEYGFPMGPAAYRDSLRGDPALDGGCIWNHEEQLGGLPRTLLWPHGWSVRFFGDGNRPGSFEIRDETATVRAGAGDVVSLIAVGAENEQIDRCDVGDPTLTPLVIDEIIRAG